MQASLISLFQILLHPTCLRCYSRPLFIPYTLTILPTTVYEGTVILYSVGSQIQQVGREQPEPTSGADTGRAAVDTHTSACFCCYCVVASPPATYMKICYKSTNNHFK